MQVLIKNMRQYKGFTLTELSNSSGVSRSALQRIEKQVVSPNLEQMEAIANALQMRIEHLIEPHYTF